MKNKQKHTKLKPNQVKFLAAYLRNKGNVTKACEIAGVKSRSTYHDWLQTEVFKTAMDSTIESHNDMVFQRILTMALSLDKDMLKFWAKNQMKHRGFVEKTEIEQVGAAIPVEIQITYNAEVEDKHKTDNKAGNSMEETKGSND